MLEEIKNQTTEKELQELRQYGDCITVQPHFIVFSNEVPSNVVGRIMALYEIWLANYDNYEIPIGKNKVYDARHGTIKTTDINGLVVSTLPDKKTNIDSSRLYKAFFKDLEIKVRTKAKAEAPEEIKANFTDFISPIDEAPALPIIADTLAYGNPHAPSIANTAFFDLFFRALTSPQYIERGHISNANEKIKVERKENDITITRSTKEESQSIKISNFNFRKRNIKTIQIFSYLFQKLAATPGANTVYVEYEELTRIGMYQTKDGARRGVDNFYDFFHGADGKGNKHIPGVMVSGIFKIKGKKVSQKELDLVIGRNKTEGGQTIYLNPYIDLRIFTAYSSFFPLWAYRLDNLEAFLLVRYIFYTARMKGSYFSNPEKGDQIEGYPYKYFKLKIDSCRDAIGLPAPEDVTGRHYKEQIRDPLEAAIESVEAEIARINNPSESILVTLTPIGTEEAKKIEQYLRCDIEIGITDEFADSFIQAAAKHEKKIAQFRERIEKEAAKNAAKKNDN